MTDKILIIGAGWPMSTSMRLGMMGAVKLSQSMNGIELPARILKGKGQRKKNKQDRWK